MPLVLTEKETALLNKMANLAHAVAGPGMGTSISGRDLNGLLEIVHSARAAVAQVDRAERRRTAEPPPPKARRGKGAPEPEPEPLVPDATLTEIVVAFSDIMESHAELWGRSPVEALAAWCEQQGITIPPEWPEALAKALGDEG